MKTFTNIQKIIIGIAIIGVLIIIWQFFIKSAEIPSTISNSLKDTTFINYVLRENENKLLKDHNEELQKIILENNSKKVIYLNDVKDTKDKISQNEKTNFNNIFITDSIIWNFSNKLTEIRLGN